jgi:hypothetical protein
VALRPRLTTVCLYRSAFGGCAYVTLTMTEKNKAVKGGWLKGLRLESARGLQLPLFTELPRRDVQGSLTSGDADSRKPSACNALLAVRRSSMTNVPYNNARTQVSLCYI